MCGGRRGRGSQATESSTGIPKIKLKLKRYGKRAEVDGKKERLSGGLFLSLFPSHWPQVLVAQRGLCRGYRPKMKVKKKEEEETLLIYTAQGSPFRRKKLSVINGSPEQQRTKTH